MDKYIGTKMIEAEPADRVHGDKAEMGYKVRYADGYESWSPKDVFEKAYMKLTVNPNLRTDKPSISQEMVDDFIVAVEVTTMGDKCTVVRAILRNGFEIVESSACVSAENYDEKLGADICMEKIKDKVWFLLGFLLQTAVNGVDGTGVDGEAKKKLFISQPMRGKTDEEILAVRSDAIQAAKDAVGEDVEVIESFFQNAPAEARPLWYLGKSLELLATADVAYFATGWEDARGCRVEHTCAVEYGVPTIITA